MQRRILWVACAIICLAPALSVAQPMSPIARGLDKRDKALLEQTQGLTQSPTRVIVRFKPDTSESERANAHASVKATVLHRSSLVPGLEVLDSELGAPNAVNALQHNPHVLYAEFDAVLRTDSLPNDHQFSLLWALNDTGGYNIHAPEAWSIFTGDPNFVIADIDTGIDLNHSDLQGNIWTNSAEVSGNSVDDDGDGYVDDVHGWDFYDNTNDPTDLNGHGTHTAGTMGAVGNNAWALTGINWHCKIMPLKFIGPNGGYTSDAIRALQYAVSKGVKISNNSWGNTTFDQSLSDAITAAGNAGHLFVTAAGNTSSNNDSVPEYPASYTAANIISVAAVDSKGNLASFSNYGSSSVDIGAPGVGVYSTYANNTLTSLDGTSMASPHVAGVAALLWGMNPTWTCSQVKNRILAKAVPSGSMKGMCVSGGLLDAYATLTDAPLPPIIRIVSPTPAASLSQPEVLLVGKATDGVDGAISSKIVWTDNVAGQIAQGPVCFVGNLSTGTHTITASVTDSRDLVTSVAQTVQVCSPGPTVSGLSMNTAPSYPEGTLVKLNASALDPSFGSLTSQIQWQSSLQGMVGQGGSVSLINLVPGTHVISAVATNGAGVTGAMPTIFTIVPATNAPSAPTNASAASCVTPTTNVKITWSDTSGNETSFDIEVSYLMSKRTWSAGSIVYHVPGDQTSLSIAAGTGYTFRYRVRSVNSVGPSTWSNYTASVKC